MNTTRFQSEGIIVLNNRDFNIDKKNRDYHFVHNRAALTEGMVFHPYCIV